MNLNQVTLPSINIETSVEFYRGMGFRQIVDSPHYVRFECLQGDATFSVHAADRMASEPCVSVYFETDDLDTQVAELQARGYDFESEPLDRSWLWREAWLRDPSSNRICLYHAGDNRKNPPWRLRD